MTGYCRIAQEGPRDTPLPENVRQFFTCLRAGAADVPWKAGCAGGGTGPAGGLQVPACRRKIKAEDG